MFGGAVGAPHDAIDSASATTADKATVRGFGRSALGASVVVAMIGPPGDSLSSSEDPSHAVKAHE
jgi:hypothetical protein